MFLTRSQRIRDAFLTRWERVHNASGNPTRQERVGFYKKTQRVRNALGFPQGDLTCSWRIGFPDALGTRYRHVGNAFTTRQGTQRVRNALGFIRKSQRVRNALGFLKGTQRVPDALGLLTRWERVMDALGTRSQRVPDTVPTR